MRLAIDHTGTSTTDALSTIMGEGNGLLSLPDKILVYDIEHL